MLMQQPCNPDSWGLCRADYLDPLLASQATFITQLSCWVWPVSVNFALVHGTQHSDVT